MVTQKLSCTFTHKTSINPLKFREFSNYLGFMNYLFNHELNNNSLELISIKANILYSKTTEIFYQIENNINSPILNHLGKIELMILNEINDIYINYQNKFYDINKFEEYKDINKIIAENYHCITKELLKR